nr:uncharacterized protein LOC111508392 [Leptinotarsa decemlineata]
MSNEWNLSDDQLKIYLRKQLSVHELEKILERNVKIFENPNEEDYSRTIAKMEIDQLQQELRSRIMMKDMKSTIAWALANTSKVYGSSAVKARQAKKMTMLNKVKRFFHLK